MTQGIKMSRILFEINVIKVIFLSFSDFNGYGHKQVFKENIKPSKIN